MSAFSDFIRNNLPAVLSGLVASGILTLFLTKYFERVQERRELFANAYKTILAWREMLYRVRRRENTKEQNRELRDRFHLLQEEIDFYQGMISVESEALGRSYSKLVLVVKTETRELIQKAWDKPIQQTASSEQDSNTNQKINEAAESFLSDVRDWLSIWQIPKIFVHRRNKK